MIVVTTPTGNIGKYVLADVSKSEQPIRVIARDPSKLPDGVGGRVEIVKGSHNEAETVNRAFHGADTVFWLAPPDVHAPSLEAAYTDFARPACEAFKSNGVKGVVVGSGTKHTAGSKGRDCLSVARHGRPDCKFRRELSRADHAFIYGQCSATDRSDQDARRLLFSYLWRPKGTDLRHS